MLPVMNLELCYSRSKWKEMWDQFPIHVYFKIAVSNWRMVCTDWGRSTTVSFTWACERFSDFLVGLKFSIKNNHKPVIPLLSTKPLEELSVRGERFRLRMLRFAFNIVYVQGKNLIIADAPYTVPQMALDQHEKYLEEDVQPYMDVIVQALSATKR